MKLLAIFRNTTLFVLLAVFFYNCAGTQKVHPTDLLPELTPQQVDAHSAIKKAGGYVEIRVLPDSAAKDQSFVNWWADQIFTTPCDTSTTTFNSNSEMSGGAKFTQTTYNFTSKKIPGGFRIFPVEYVKPEPVAPLYASVGANDDQKDITPVFDFFVGSVTFLPGDIIIVPLGPISMTKARDIDYPVGEMLYSVEQLRPYVPQKEVDGEISKTHWGEPKM